MVRSREIFVPAAVSGLRILAQRHNVAVTGYSLLHYG